MGEKGNFVKLRIEQESNGYDVLSVLNQIEASTRKEGFASKLYGSSIHGEACVAQKVEWKSLFNEAHNEGRELAYRNLKG